MQDKKLKRFYLYEDVFRYNKYQYNQEGECSEGGFFDGQIDPGEFVMPYIEKDRTVKPCDEGTTNACIGYMASLAKGRLPKKSLPASDYKWRSALIYEFTIGEILTLPLNKDSADIKNGDYLIIHGGDTLTLNKDPKDPTKFLALEHAVKGTKEEILVRIDK